MVTMRDLYGWGPEVCDGTGSETFYSPNAKRLVCSTCGQEVPVESDHKRTWFKRHDRKESS